MTEITVVINWSS